MAGVRGLAALGRLIAAGSAEPDGDAALLARFAATGDEAAFAALVRRHGPAVAAVCRRHLRQPADVDDAVQANFLLLARKAGAVHTAVGPWLYRVAGRTAGRLRRSVRATEPLPDLPARAGLPADVRAALADELARLPEQYRLAVELCYVAGHTTAEAADRLGWPKGTVLTRLAWARKRLRANLTRRGVTLGGSLAAVLLDRTAASGGRVRVSGESDRVLSLCEGAMRAMTLTKLLWGAGLTAVAVGGLGVGSWAVGQGPATKAAVTRKVDPPPAVPSLPPPQPSVELPRAVRGEVPDPIILSPVPAPVNEPPGKTYTVPHPAGSFIREFADGERFAVRFDADRLYVEATFGDKAKPVSVSLDADYAINKEGVVFGVVTGAECDGLDRGHSLALITSRMVGGPFAFRVRVDDGSVSVQDLRLYGLNLPADRATSEPALAGLLNAVAGRYVASKEPVASSRKPGKSKLPKFSRPEPTEVPVPAVSIPTTVPSVGPPVGGPPAQPPSGKTT